MAQAGTLSGIDERACLRYTQLRQTEEGGFCFYANREWGVQDPNTPDTLAAVTILHLLGQPVPARERCIAWLHAQQDVRGEYPSLVIGYAALKALRLLGSAPLRDPRSFLRHAAGLLGLDDETGRAPTSDLAAACRCIELWHDFGLAASAHTRTRIAALLERRRAPNGAYGAENPTLSETASAVALAGAFEIEVDAGAIVRHLRQCEGPPFGINVAPLAGAADLQSQRAALWLLRRFAARPRYPELVRRHVAQCQDDRGGFGRSPGAIARLSDTRRALEILDCLAQAGAGPAMRNA